MPLSIGLYLRKHYLKRIIFVGLCLLGGSPKGWSTQYSTSTNDIYILTHPSQIELLNQKLEYSIDKGQSVQIGNLVISESNLNITLNNLNQLVLEAPLQFMVGGKLILKDPHGISIWTNEITSLDQVQVSEKNKTRDAETRETSGRYYLKLRGSIKDELLETTFFSFCTYVETPINRMQACTPSKSLKFENEKWSLETIKNGEIENTILVNGVEVNDHGIIQFDKNIRTVSMAATLSSGLSVEVRTDYIPLESYNLRYVKDSPQITLTFREKPTKNKKVYPWIAQIDLTAPSFYIEALGQVPLKQEIAIHQENLPESTFVPTLLSAPKKTYNDEVAVVFKSEKDFELLLKTKGDKLTNIPTGITWSIKNLKRGLNKPHFLQISKSGITSTAAYEVEQGAPWDFKSILGRTLLTQINSGTDDFGPSTFMGFSISRYYDSLIGNDSNFDLRWGTHFEHSRHQTTNSQRTSSEVTLSYRLSPTFHHIESAQSVKVAVLSTSESQQSNLYLGFKWGHDGPTSWAPKLFGTQHETQLAYYFQVNQDVSSTSILQWNWESRYPFRRSQYWGWNGLLDRVTTSALNGRTPLVEAGLTLSLVWGFYL